MIDQFKKNIPLEDKLTIAHLCYVASADGVDQSFTSVFCTLLNLDWHYMHEDIVMMLDQIKDPLSVDCIFDRSLKIPLNDDGRSLAKKCIWALVSINTERSREKVKELSKIDDDIIKENAMHYVNKWGI